MTLPIYNHPDGGSYVIVDDLSTSMKMADGSWQPAVLYRRVIHAPGGGFMYEGKNQFCTTKERWAERFTLAGDTGR